MPIDAARAKDCLKAFDFRRLFIEELGWDNLRQTIPIDLGEDRFVLTGCAHKRGMQVFVCAIPTSPGIGNLPNYALLSKIGHRAVKAAHEHIIIFVDPQQTTQTWQWIKHEIGKPDRFRRHTVHPGHSGEALIQKLDDLAFTLDEEERLTLPDVTGRARRTFDQNAERVTRRFYDRFQNEHGAFLSFIEGITGEADRKWYASIMLNRLMFVYFIQKKRYLDGDLHYLRNRLRTVQQQKGKGKFLSFYRCFLRRLMHEGFGQTKSRRKADLESLIGNVPYLNGGIFDEHELEAVNPDIDIPDEAFERIFDFFDEYDWHLDNRPLRSDREINPDVLGYIFEKYVNQKQMGAYYTKEDITEYISKNTVLPFLFDAARKQCAVAFKPGSALWRLLQDEPDRYIYEAVRKGVIDDDGNEIALPPQIEAGIADVSKRTGWNATADRLYALPTETWREHVARRQRCLELRRKLTNGEVHEINDLITLNLDIRQFALDVIESCEGPELLRAFYSAITGITILDPTCGSGAFLFAALNILEPLYEACLDRMEQFIADADALAELPTDRQPRITKAQQSAYSDFRAWLAAIADHPSAKYFIYKSIILSNLFGVDIMEEATEICRLRLFLKLVAQVEPDPDKPNLGIEPLPDIDFNIRAGNTLVGFTSIEEVRDSQKDWLALAEGEIREIETSADGVDRMFRLFREAQTTVKPDSEQMAVSKKALRDAIGRLNDRLDRFLAGEYGIDADNPKQESAYEKWRKSHKPFHWITEFYGIMHAGGFDAILGNPPYLDIRSLVGYELRGYTTLSTRNLYAVCLERAIALASLAGRLGMIVPVSSISTQGYSPLQSILFRRAAHFSSFDDRPSRLFDGLEHIQLTIHLLQSVNTNSTSALRTTECYRWSATERQVLFPCLEYETVEASYLDGCIPKISRPLEHAILNKVWADSLSLSQQTSRLGQHIVYYSRKVHNFLQAVDFIPEVYDGSGNLRPPTELKELRFTTPEFAAVALCILNSTLFRWCINVFTDCRHVNRREVDGFRMDIHRAISTHANRWLDLARALSKELRDTSEYRQMRFRHDNLRVQCIIPKHAKPIIDEIDGVLAEHYGFTAEELDFIVNYDIKYRLGASPNDAGN